MKTITLIIPGAAPKPVSAPADQTCEICGRDGLTVRGLATHQAACRRKHVASVSDSLADVSDHVAPLSQPVASESHQCRIHPSIPAAGAAAVAEVYGELYDVQEQFWPSPATRSCRLMEFGSFLHPENTSRVIPAAAQRERAQRQFDEHRTSER
jgi:hypothetical protein